MIRIVVADDQLLVRSGFRIILEQQADFVVCGEASTGAEAVRLTRELDPDIVLMDIRMPQLNGLEATRSIVRESPRSRVLVLTTYDLDEYVVGALREGASGYLLKDVRPDELVRCVRAVVDGELTLSPAVVRRLAAEFLGRAVSPVAEAGIQRLSVRELTVFAQLARGLTNAEIAERLVVSRATVKTHVANILAKLGLRDRVQAVILAHESGFVHRDELA